MYARILVAVDGSDTSRRALLHAIQLAGISSATLRIVHVVDMSWLPVGPEIAIDTEVVCAARRRAGGTILQSAQETATKAGVAVEAALIETGAPTQHVAEAIAEEAVRWSTDLVVLGTHGRRGMQRLMLGSVAEEITRLSPGPVLLVPAPRSSVSD